jgi:hypothetical protein
MCDPKDLITAIEKGISKADVALEAQGPKHTARQAESVFIAARRRPFG